MSDTATGIGDPMLRSVAHEFAGAKPLADFALDVARSAWSEMCALGWPLIGIDESRGGEGGSLSDLIAVLSVSAEHALSTPLAEHALAGWILVETGAPAPAGPNQATVALRGNSGGVSIADVGKPVLDGQITRVPWARTAETVVVPWGRSMIVLDRSVPGWDVKPDTNLAGEPRDTVVFNNCEVPTELVLADGPDEEAIRNRAAVLRGAQLLGALALARSLTRTHINTRHQFGRPLIDFQAVAGAFARAASSIVAAEDGLALACRMLERCDSPSAQAYVAAARIGLGEAAAITARVAHQLHGAVGTTREHQLHLATRRLWSWRDEWGTQRHWSERLAGGLTLETEDPLWDLVSAAQLADSAREDVLHG
jgi:acyl-CoA dehydrogenase